MSTGTLAPWFSEQYFDSNGDPLAFGTIDFYAAGTLVRQDTFSDVGLTTANANPVVLNAAGRPVSGSTIVPIYFTPGSSYKAIIKNSLGVVQDTRDNIGAVPASTVDVDVTGTAGETLASGDCVYLSDGTGGLTTGRWYKADADLAYASSSAGMIGFAIAAIMSGAIGSIRIAGRLTGLTGLTIGVPYYVSATAGAVTTVAPTNTRTVGIADSLTAIVLAPNPGNQFIGIVSKTATYTVAVTDGRDVLVKVDATAGAVTVNLYTAVGNAGRGVRVVKTDSTVNAVTIDPNSTETINGVTTLVLIGQWDSATLISDGANLVGLPVVASQPRAVAFNNGTQNLAISTPAVLTLDSEDVDVGGMHSTSANTERITIPTGGGGYYRVTAFTSYLQAASAIDGKFTFSIRKSGTVIKSGEFANPVADFKYPALLVWEGTLAAAEYVEMFVDPGARQFTVGSATRGFSSTLSAIRLH